MTPFALASLGLGFAAGLLGGFAYFLLLRRQVERLAAAADGPGSGARYVAARLGVLLLLLGLLVWLGAPAATLAFLGGFLVARVSALRRWGPQPTGREGA
jgi:hypothetical protein